MKKCKKTTYIVLTIILSLMTCLIPYKVTVDNKAKEEVVSHAVKSLIQRKTVFTNSGLKKLHDCKFVKNDGRLYFRNELGIPDAIFIKNGLKSITNREDLDVDNGDVIISFGHRWTNDSRSKNIYFSYKFGSLGAQGYIINIYKSLLLNYFVYSHDWVS